MKDIGLKFILHSGTHKLVFKDGTTEIIDNGLWLGTIVYMEISTSMEINPNDVVDHRTDAEEQFNEAFVDTEEIESLWKNQKADEQFFFSRFGTDFGTREMGCKIRNELLAVLSDNKRVALDFTNVNVVSNSFADECIAKLLFGIPLQELKKQITFCGLSQMAERSILVALQRRYKVLKQQIM